MSRDPCKTVSRVRVLPLLRVLGALWVVAAMAGCATTAKLNAFGELSKVGMAYADAADAVIAQAAEGSIAADTAVLVVTRQGIPAADQRLTMLTAQSKALRTQLALLGDIQRHQSLIKDYFVALGALANAGDTDSAIGTAAGDTITALGKLSSGFAGKTIGGQSLPDFAGQSVPLVVAALRSRALERELKANGATINHELVVSEQLMGFLADKIKSDDAAFEGPREAAAVFGPYTANAPLPADWPAQRSAFLRRSADLSTVSSAQDAARKLRLALAAAAEDHLSPGQLQLLAQDLSTLVDILEKIRRVP